MKKLMALLLALVMVMSLAACGKQKTNENTGDAASGDATPPAEITYAVEAGSAGEEVAPGQRLQDRGGRLSGQRPDGSGCRHR